MSRLRKLLFVHKGVGNAGASQCYQANSSLLESARRQKLAFFPDKACEEYDVCIQSSRSMNHRQAFRRISIGIASIWLAVGLTYGASRRPAPALPFPIPAEQSLDTRWLKKAVLDSQSLDEMEQTNQWSLIGSGTLSLSGERSKAGQHSIRLQTSTNLPLRRSDPGHSLRGGGGV